MKIQFTPKKVRLVRIAIALVAISLAGYVAYAATQLSIGPNSGTIILATKNWQGVSFNPGATGFPTSAATCPTTGYSDTPSAIAFGSSIPQGTTVTGAVCVKNVSTGAQSYTASTAASPPPSFPAGTTVAYSADGGTAVSGSIAPNGISLLTITLTAGQTVGAVSFTTVVA
jgi:hypothetical protein